MTNEKLCKALKSALSTHISEGWLEENEYDEILTALDKLIDSEESAWELLEELKNSNGFPQELRIKIPAGILFN